MKKYREKQPGLNFRKLVKTLSNNALKYLISVAHAEAGFRNLTIPKSSLNEELPIITIKGEQTIHIKDTKYVIDSYDIGDGNIVELEKNQFIKLNLEELDWLKLKKDNTPIKIFLSGENDSKTVELHSRSKIFWFNKLIETTTENSLDDFKFDQITFDD